MTTAPSTSTTTTSTTVPAPSTTSAADRWKLPDPAKVDRTNPVIVAGAAGCNLFALYDGESDQDVANRLAPLVTPELKAYVEYLGLGGEPATTIREPHVAQVIEWPGSDGSTGYYVWCGDHYYFQGQMTGENPEEPVIVTLQQQSDGTWLASRFTFPTDNQSPPTDGLW